MLSERKKNKLIIFYFFISTLIFAFVAIPGGGGYFASVDVQIFYVPGKPIIIHFFVTLAMVYILMISTLNNAKFFGLHFLLLFFAIVPIVTHLYNNDFSMFTTHYPAILITLFAFYIGGQYTGELDSITTIIMIFALILSTQVIAAAVVSGLPITHPDYKYYIRIPIAASNVIAALLNPCLFLILKHYNKNMAMKWAILSFITSAVFLTRSRGGVIILLIIFVWILYKKKTRYNTLRRLFLVLFFIALVAILLNIPGIEQFFLGYKDISYGSDDFFNRLSAGRLDLYEEEIIKILQHPLIGNGMIFAEGYSGAHNLIISLLTQFGVIGFLLYTSAVVRVFFINSRHKNKYGLEGILLFLIVSILHGMIELNFFNYSGDMIFWFLAGVLIGIIKKNETQSKSI